jgi:hypothetical protein
MTKETVQVFAVAIGVIVFLEWSREEEGGGADPVVLFRAT